MFNENIHTREEVNEEEDYLAVILNDDVNLFNNRVQNSQSRTKKSNTMKFSNFNMLPNDTLYVILTYICISEIKEMRKVCRDWNTILCDDNYLNEKYQQCIIDEELYQELKKKVESKKENQVFKLFVKKFYIPKIAIGDHFSDIEKLFMIHADKKKICYDVVHAKNNGISIRNHIFLVGYYYKYKIDTDLFRCFSDFIEVYMNLWKEEKKINKKEENLYYRVKKKLEDYITQKKVFKRFTFMCIHGWSKISRSNKNCIKLSSYGVRCGSSLPLKSILSLIDLPYFSYSDKIIDLTLDIFEITTKQFVKNQSWCYFSWFFQFYGKEFLKKMITLVTKKPNHEKRFCKLYVDGIYAAYESKNVDFASKFNFIGWFEFLDENFGTIVVKQTLCSENLNRLINTCIINNYQYIVKNCKILVKSYNFIRNVCSNEKRSSEYVNKVLKDCLDGCLFATSMGEFDHLIQSADEFIYFCKNIPNLSKVINQEIIVKIFNTLDFTFSEYDELLNCTKFFYEKENLLSERIDKEFTKNLRGSRYNEVFKIFKKWCIPDFTNRLLKFVKEYFESLLIEIDKPFVLFFDFLNELQLYSDISHYEEFVCLFLDTIIKDRKIIINGKVEVEGYLSFCLFLHSLEFFKDKISLIADQLDPVDLLERNMSNGDATSNIMKTRDDVITFCLGLITTSGHHYSSGDTDRATERTRFVLSFIELFLKIERESEKGNRVSPFLQSDVQSRGKSESQRVGDYKIFLNSKKMEQNQMLQIQKNFELSKSIEKKNGDNYDIEFEFPDDDYDDYDDDVKSDENDDNMNLDDDNGDPVVEEEEEEEEEFDN